MTDADRGPWIQTFTGKRFFLDPSPDEIDIEDIAHALSNTCRFAGHCSEFYSVPGRKVISGEIQGANKVIHFRDVNTMEFMTRVRTERGKSREEFHNGQTQKKEAFGLNKRARRLAKGIVCSYPDGTFESTRMKVEAK